MFIHRKRVSLRFFLFLKQEVFLQSFFYGVILILSQPNCLQKYEPIICYNLRVIIPEHFPEIFVLTFLVAYVRKVTNFHIAVPFFFFFWTSLKSLFLSYYMHLIFCLLWWCCFFLAAIVLYIRNSVKVDTRNRIDKRCFMLLLLLLLLRKTLLLKPYLYIHERMI